MSHSCPVFPSGIKVIHLEELPPLHLRISSANKAQHLQDYFLNLQERFMFRREALLLPSLDSLTKCLNVQQHDILDALKTLRHRGYDNFIPGLFGPITFWNPTLPKP